MSPSTGTGKGSGPKSRTVVLDSWAWWEILHGTPVGRRLSKRYLEVPGVRVLTVDLTLAEVAGTLSRLGKASLVAGCLRSIEAAADVLPISAEIAKAAGALLPELRKVDAQASLADAVILAAAREKGAILISADPCFRGQPDVRQS